MSGIVLNVNLRGAFFGAQEAARRMSSAGRPGVIINVASTGAFTAGGPLVADYVASKHGLLGLTKALAVELGPLAIRVLAVAPTLTNTPGIAELAGSAGADGASLIAAASTRQPLGRVAVPDDIARVVLFCATDMAILMTGSAVLVDAGQAAV